ncbi:MULTISPECIES: hypothetical protein [unclassified Leptolyngbya]|uniref:hypothetical protein n=1 Tax=unclassified Leptolyngbya TaxID=2650499 RepID=UPI001687C486|nr:MULTISPECIES: hypothetical protein [unclassified Leptolyngbya]MBD1909734.1 hypothetical protein [Leptolyngbya sp. FACHB-8]MBD2156312.1 hypothetical protein [Leptolyngbya sp. FACHB-16]
MLLQLALMTGWGAAQLLPSRPQVLPGQVKNFEVLWPPPSLTLEQAQTLFATTNSVGAIAIGMAEGTRTIEGDRTSAWQSHVDPANEAINQGTFSWQGNAISARHADQQAINHIQTTVIPSLLEDGAQQGVMLNPRLLIQGVDLWIQSPAAGTAFISNLKNCQRQNKPQHSIILCARVRSYYDSQTGELDASGFNNNPDLLVQDQLRRIRKVEQAVAWNQQRVSDEWLQTRR